jgi:hypothetical protein
MRTLGNKSLRRDLKVGTLLLYREYRAVSRMDLLLPRIFQVGCQKGATSKWRRMCISSRSPLTSALPACLHAMLDGTG